jgi:hypothetical protein
VLTGEAGKDTEHFIRPKLFPFEEYPDEGIWIVIFLLRMVAWLSDGEYWLHSFTHSWLELEGRVPGWLFEIRGARIEAGSDARHTVSTVDPVVFRAARSAWALAASFSG